MMFRYGIVLLFGCISQQIWGQPEPAKPPEPVLVELKMAVVKEPRPSLRYAFQVELQDRVAGNAAISYHRAIMMMNENRAPRKPEENQRLVQIDEGLRKPKAEWPIQLLREELKKVNSAVLAEVAYAAKQIDCDWDLDRRIERDGVAVLLPEVQMMREFAKLIQYQFRLHLHDNQLEEAWKDLQIGFALSRHVCQGPTLIQALVGIAIESIMMNELEIFLQEAKAPNLYWALTTMPREHLSLRRAFESESRLLTITMPKLHDIEKGPLTAEAASKMLTDLIEKLNGIMGPNQAESANLRRFGLAAMVVLQHPTSKQRLIDRGRTEDSLKDMPAAQLVLLNAVEEYNEIRDEMFRNYTLPYYQGKLWMDKAETKMRKFRQENAANVATNLLLLLLPATNRVMLAVARTERKYEFLRTIEAIRLHVETTKKIPDTLNEVTMPLQLDPLLGKPFQYKKINDKQYELRADAPEGEPIRVYGLHYRITLDLTK